jgi:hypothetical protein
LRGLADCELRHGSFDPHPLAGSGAPTLAQWMANLVSGQMNQVGP